MICKNEDCNYNVLGEVKLGICDLCAEEEFNSSDWESDDDEFYWHERMEGCNFESWRDEMGETFKSIDSNYDPNISSYYIMVSGKNYREWCERTANRPAYQVNPYYL